ncbi:hypothetical protein AN958_08718 [Leucoagaricus sp. SymC.cos]|nr:hypothetical protein AN958_08718 [Leucoagaricus sp. SymC.cos]
MSDKDQLGAKLTHADGAIMTYDVLSAPHFNSNKVPIVLIGGMTSLRGDWERLVNVLAEVRPVNPNVNHHDHRGMGESTYTPEGDEEITIKLYARDILGLFNTHLKWPRLAIWGFSMRGAVAQQLLLLPYHKSSPAPLHPFEITRVFLTGTLASPMRDRRYSLKNGEKRSGEERKELVRPILEGAFDESWMSDAKNRERFESLLERMIGGSALLHSWTCSIIPHSISKQIINLDFNAPHSCISSSIPLLVIHGENDSVVPFFCNREILALIPHARAVGIGNARGQVPSLKFGHQWFEYFDVKVWVGVVEEFMKTQGKLRETKIVKQSFERRFH